MAALRRSINASDIAEARARGTRYIQRDGAMVHLLETAPGRYFYFVENIQRDLIVTVSDRMVRRHGIERLAQRYGWERE